MLIYLLSISSEETKPKIRGFYREYKEDLIKLAISVLKDAGDTNYLTDAQDVVQNTFVRVTRYINKFPRMDVSHQKAYLYAIAENEIRDFLDEYNKLKNISLELTDIPDNKNFLEDIDIKERYNEVVDAIYALDERYSTVLLFRYAENYSVKRIAQVLGVDRAVVYSRLRKGKTLLLEKLEGKGEEQ